MLLSISRNLLTTPKNRPFLRDPERHRIAQVRAVIAHWTANEDRGANALANRNYFNLGLRSASAHYCVDDRSVVQCLPDHEVGWHVGALRYKAEGRRLRVGTRGPNFSTIGFEMCVNADGNWERTYQNSAALAAFLLRKHNLSIESDLVRHYDITGKDCPKMMVSEPEWQQFKRVVHSFYLTIVSAIPATTTTSLNVRDRPGGNVLYALYPGERVLTLSTEKGWACIAPGQFVAARFLSYIE